MTNKEKIPVEALEMVSRGEAVNFNHTEGAKDEGLNVTLLARSSKAIDHWYWGSVVHDLEGMKVKERIPLDFNHNPDEIIGYLDEFEITEEGLLCHGKLTPFSENDRASEIAFKSKAGVPWESSISFGGDGIVLENIGDDPVTVNGLEFSNGTVVREWPFRACAICPSGADANTSSAVFNSGDLVEVTVLSKEKKMDDNKESEFAEVAEDVIVADLDEVQEDEVLEEAVDQVSDEQVEDSQEEAVVEDAEEAVVEEAVELSDPRAECRQFVEQFGAENGGQWFAEGLSLAEATSLHNQGIEDERDELLKEVAELRQRLSSIERGEDAPLQFSNSDDNEEAERRNRFERKRREVGSGAIAAFENRFETKQN